MDIQAERSAAVAAAIEQMRSLAGQPGFGRAQLVQIRAIVEGLAARKELWSADQFASPGAEERQARYLIHEDADKSYALYLNIMNRGKRTPIHNHTTWACIAAVDGVEHNYVYKRLDDGSRAGYAEVVEDGVVVIRPGGEGIALMPDDIHSVQIEDSDQIRHLHMYGRALETLSERVAYDLPNRTYKKMDIGVTSRRAAA
jgi:predicted metal-dependent enzyme (double-stranded beta helix superfamily)